MCVNSRHFSLYFSLSLLIVLSFALFLSAFSSQRQSQNKENLDPPSSPVSNYCKITKDVLTEHKQFILICNLSVKNKATILRRFIFTDRRV